MSNENRKSKIENRNTIPYGKQHITDEDIQAVIQTLKSDYLTQGPKIKEFEDAFSNYVGSKYAVAVANGTAALHLCTLALNVQSGQKVITTPITFAASANCVRYCGGEVVFADINPETYLLDIKSVRSLLESSPKGTYQGIIPVDFAGRAVDLEAFRTLADEFGCWIIEDACHAPGGFFIDSKGNKQFCGNGNFADLAIFSFHPVKHIACGEGGMVTTNNLELYEKLLMLRTHGITRNVEMYQNSAEFPMGNSIFDVRDSKFEIRNSNHEPQTTNHEPRTTKNEYPGWYMEMQTLGYNYRLTDFQAALGISQLKRADEGLARRREIAGIYKQAFKNIPQIIDRNFGEVIGELETGNSSPLTAHRSPNYGHAHHLYIIEVPNRLELYNYLREQHIFAQIHYIPTHLMPYYRQFGWKEGDMPKAESYYTKCISLPMYPTISDNELHYVIERIISYYAS